MIADGLTRFRLSRCRRTFKPNFELPEPGAAPEMEVDREVVTSDIDGPRGEMLSSRVIKREQELEHVRT